MKQLGNANQQQAKSNPKFVKRVQQLLDILLTKKKYKQKPFTYLGISFDLVLAMSIPDVAVDKHEKEGKKKEETEEVIKEFVFPDDKGETKMYEQEAITIGEIRKSVPPELAVAYENAIKEILRTTNQTTPGRYLLRYNGGLRKNPPEEAKEYYAVRNKHSVFELVYNSLILTLQKQCGFICQKIILTDKIFILISCTDENLMRAAHKYGMKKQVLYSQIDVMLNQPIDQKYRPLRFNTYLLQSDEDIKRLQLAEREGLRTSKKLESFTANDLRARESKKSSADSKKSFGDSKNKKNDGGGLEVPVVSDRELFNLAEHKRLYRKIGKAPASDQVEEIKQQVILSRKEKQKYRSFLTEYYDLLENFDNLYQTQILRSQPRQQGHNRIRLQITKQDRQYLQTLLPQRKLNAGCSIMYEQIVNKRIYFNKVRQIMKKHNYSIFANPPVYTEFFRLSKHKKFSDKLKTLLMFKPLIVDPFYNKKLFLRMQRTKLAYLIMQQFLRVENFKKMKIDVFTLHNSYEKSGKIPPALKDQIENPNQMAGGLDGLNLEKNWNPFTPWKSDVTLIRNYLGQKPAFLIMLKNHIIWYLMGLCPLAILAYVIMLVVLPNYGVANIHINQFSFFLTFELILIAWLTILTADWNRKANDFVGSFVQKRARKTILAGYKAPYMRNLATDLVNDFSQSKSFVQKLIQAANYCIILAILGIDVAIFYGIRKFDHALTQNLYNNSFVRWQQLLPVFIFFVGNHLLYTLLLKRFITYLTSLQNNPNIEKSQNSEESKRLLFLIGLELIGPIDILIVEPLNRTSCNNTSCYEAYDTFIESRFIVIFIMIAFRFLVLIFKIIVQKVRARMVRQGVAQGIHIDYRLNAERQQFKSLVDKLLKQYQMPQFTSHVQDQILVLVHISLFSITLPISIAINLFNVLMQYYLQRIDLLFTCRRPINCLSMTSIYSNLVHIPLYLFCAVNAWLLFVTFQDWEYVAPGYFTWLVAEPTVDAVITIKIITSFVWFLVLLLLSKGVRHVYDEYVTSDNINRRKDYKLKEYLYNFKRARNVGVGRRQVPMRFMGRVQMRNG